MNGTGKNWLWFDCVFAGMGFFLMALPFHNNISSALAVIFGVVFLILLTVLRKGVGIVAALIVMPLLGYYVWSLYRPESANGLTDWNRSDDVVQAEQVRKNGPRALLSARQDNAPAAASTSTRRGEQQIEVELHADRWSEKVIPPAGVKFSFEDGPPDARVRFENGVEGSVYGENFGVRADWLDGFRFKGREGGKITVKYVPL